MPIPELSQELQGNEVLKDFNSAEDLAKSFVELRGRASSGSIELLPEELRKDATIANYKTLPDVAKALIETKKLVGTIKRAPAKPEEYKFTPLEGLHPSVKVTPEFQKWYSAEAHKLDLPNEQADGMQRVLFGYLSNLMVANDKAREEKFKVNDAAVRAEFGGEYDNKFNNVLRMLKAAGGEEGVAELGANLKTAPLALKTLAKISDLLSEDSFKALGENTQVPVEKADEALFNELANAIRTNDPKHPINNEKDPNHKKAKADWDRVGGLFEVKRG
jgi:hypothetical protein